MTMSFGRSSGLASGGGTRPRVLLADDHVLVAEAFAQLLASECDVVGTVGDGRALVAEAERLKPDVAVVDVAMPVLNGLDATREIKRRLPRTKIVCVTMNEDPEVSREAFRAGVSAFLLKSSGVSELMMAIRAVTNGRSYVTPTSTRDLVDACLGPDVNGGRGRTLTPRQRDVLVLLAAGRSLKQSAALLHITPRTVAFHKYQMMAQLRIKSTPELIRFAIEQDLVARS